MAAREESAEVASLLPHDEETDLRRRWEEIQTRFAREQLEGQWSRGEDVSTEDLRVALQRYRSFFQRLLSA